MFPEIAIALLVVLITFLIGRRIRKKLNIKKSLFSPNEKLLIAYCNKNEFDKFVDHFNTFKINPNATDYVFMFFFYVNIT